MNTSYDNNYVGYKVRLFPTKDQEKIFHKYFKICRFVYNLGIDIEKENYETNKKFLSFYSLNNKFNSLKNSECAWLKQYDATTLRYIIRDVVVAYERFFEGTTKYPKYKNSYGTKKQFPVRPDRMSIGNNTIKLQTFGVIKYCNSYGECIIGNGDDRSLKNKILKFNNARISFDGLYFYLSFTIRKDQNHNVSNYDIYKGNNLWNESEYNTAVGIDVGIRNNKWIKDSRGITIVRPDSKKIYKKINRLQRKLSRQKNTNLEKNSSYFEQHPNGSKNMQKTKDKINRLYKKIANRRKNEVYEYANNLLKYKPKAVVIEDIKMQEFVDRSSNMFNSNIMIRNIYDAALYDTLHIIERKMINNDIPVIRADSQYPSSQICSCCGHRQNIGRKQIYKCPVCGTTIDRDFNAAINLSRLAY